MVAAGPQVPFARGDYDIVQRLGQTDLSTVRKARRRAMAASSPSRRRGRMWSAIRSCSSVLSRSSPRGQQPAPISHLVRGPSRPARRAETPYRAGICHVDGPSLGDCIQRQGRLPEAEAVRIVTQIAEALHYAHGRRVIHRDVKPDNILLDPDGRAKLIDLGLAKDIDADVQLTRPSAGLGTPNFMAPEQFSSRQARRSPLHDILRSAPCTWPLLAYCRSTPRRRRRPERSLTTTLSRRLHGPRWLAAGSDQRSAGRWTSTRGARRPTWNSSRD